MYIPLGAVAELFTSVAAWMGSSGRREHLVSRSTIKEIDAVRQRWGIPGMAVAVVTSPRSHHGQGVQFLNFGTATNDGKPVDSDSLFCIASNSKLFAALSVLKMIDDGVTLPSGAPLSLATKVKDVLPEWGLMGTTRSCSADTSYALRHALARLFV
jgi:CubicO group peptidase (beta-lactamase class C family)